MSALYQEDLAHNARLQKLRFFPLAPTGGLGCCVMDEAGRRRTIRGNMRRLQTEMISTAM